MLACISGCSGVIGCKVATGGVLRVKKFAQHRLIVGVSVKKFALRARNTPNLTFLRLLGELCHGLSGGEGVPGEFCHAYRLATVTGPCSATGPVPVPEQSRPRHRLPAPPPPAGPATIVCGASGTLHIGVGGGFAALGAGCRRVGGVSGF